MSRMHPGKPPSRRTEPGKDWRDNVRNATSMIVTGLRGRPGNDGPAIRQKVILAVREALGQASGDGMVKTIDFPEQQGKPAKRGPVLSTAGVYRLILSDERMDRHDPMFAESFMQAVVETLDDELGP
jgi:hypothetical protein